MQLNGGDSCFKVYSFVVEIRGDFDTYINIRQKWYHLSTNIVRL